MYKFNFGFQWKSSAQIETEVVTLALEEKNIDSDIKQLEENSISNVVQTLNSCNQNLTKTSSEQQLENLLSNLLKYGVLIASAVVLLGGILYLIRHGAEPADYKFFQGEPSKFRSPDGVVQAVLSGSSRGIIQLGLLLLIATPVLRVIVSLLTFIRQREFIYVIITSLVMASLTYSFIGASY
jgi:uncharacterized membrane protein